MTKFCQLQLSCTDESEADKIARALLDKKLVACAKQVPITSDFLWKGKIDHGDEVLLMMESREDLFDQIETEVAKLHSYDSFVLTATPITKISKKAQKWLNDSLEG